MTGHPVSRVPGLLKDIVVRGTEQLQAVLKEGELADLEIAGQNSGLVVTLNPEFPSF